MSEGASRKCRRSVSGVARGCLGSVSEVSHLAAAKHVRVRAEERRERVGPCGSGGAQLGAVNADPRRVSARRTYRTTHGTESSLGSVLWRHGNVDEQRGDRNCRRQRSACPLERWLGDKNTSSASGDVAPKLPTRDMGRYGGIRGDIPLLGRRTRVARHRPRLRKGKAEVREGTLLHPHEVVVGQGPQASPSRLHV